MLSIVPNAANSAKHGHSAKRDRVNMSIFMCPCPDESAQCERVVATDSALAQAVPRAEVAACARRCG